MPTEIYSIVTKGNLEKPRTSIGSVRTAIFIQSVIFVVSFSSALLSEVDSIASKSIAHATMQRRETNASRRSRLVPV